MPPVWAECTKRRMFREVWVGYLLGAAYFLLSLWQTLDHNQWFYIQQDIYSYGNTLAAFLIVIGLSRLMCCEREYGTDQLVRTSERGAFLVWRAKAALTVGYCALVVLVIGAVSLLVHVAQTGFRDALAPAGHTVYFPNVPLSNLGYCVVQYLFLFLGALYFAVFVLLVAQLTRRTALTVFLCGGIYLVLLGYRLVGHFRIQDPFLNEICLRVYNVSFTGFMIQDSFCGGLDGWYGFGIPWSEAWKPVVLVILLAAVEFGLSWLLWKRRART